MLGLFSNRLTALSNHYVDWSRVAELIFSANHRYTWEQLQARGLIVLCAATSGFIGAYFNDEKKTGYSTVPVAMVLFLAGGIVSHHFIAVHPLIQKRKAMSKECEQLKLDIGKKLDGLQADWVDLVHATVAAVMQQSLADENHSRATQTWGWRKRLLGNINESLNEDAEQCWQGDVAGMIERLSDNTMPQRVSVCSRL